MAKKKKPLRCSHCGKLLLEVIGHCSSVQIICSECNSSLLVDIDEDGKQVVKLIPDLSNRVGQVQTQANKQG